MRSLNFTQWNPDYINALSDKDYNGLKSTEANLANRLQDFLTAYDIRPDEYQGEHYIHPLDLSPGVFGKGINEEEFCVKFDEDILYGVKSGRGGRYQVATFSLSWIKLNDVPKIVNLYSDSIYRDKTPEQLQAVDQLVAKQREYMTMLDSVDRKREGV